MVGDDEWALIDLFWMCHTKAAGMASAVAQQIGFPDPGAVGDQDNLIMEAFGVINTAFLNLQHDLEKKTGRTET